jgi:ParB/RepB/Spo0J family partition protein
MRKIDSREISLDLIDPDPGQPRQNKPIEYLRELGNSIKSRGLRNAIHVRPNPDEPDRYIIINGECRYSASCLVNLKTIYADIYEYDHENLEGEVFVDQLMDNGVRKGLDPLEELQGYQKAIDMGMTVHDIAAAYGKSAEVIEKDLPILRLPKILLNLYDKGEMPKAVARKIAERPNEGQMLKAWEWARMGKNVDGMIAKINAYVVKASQGKIFDVFDQATDIATQTEKKAAKVAADKLVKAIGEFANSPFANGKGELMLVVNSKKMPEIEYAASEMAKIAAKILGDIKNYKARSKSAKA